MASSLSEEEFHRMQLQLLELRTANYELDSKCKKQERDLVQLNETADSFEKEWQKSQKAVNKSKKAKEVELLLQENDVLQRKLASQEEDFRLQNETLMQELSNLVSSNESLEKEVKDLKAGGATGGRGIGSSEQTGLEDEVRRLQAQNSALQKNLTGCQEKYERQISELRDQLHNRSRTLSHGETDITDGIAISDVTDSCQPSEGEVSTEITGGEDITQIEDISIDSLQKMIDELKLNLDTELEEKKILRQEKTKLEHKLNEDSKVHQDEIKKLTEKVKKKQESYVHLQEEKENLFKDLSKKIEDLHSMKDRDQKYYTEQINKLQIEIERYKKSQEEMNSSSGQRVRELEDRIATLQKQIDAANIVESQHIQEQTQKLSSQNKDLQSHLLTLTQQRDDFKVQLQESQKASQEASEQLCAIQQDRDKHIHAVQEANKLAEKRKTLLDDLAIKYQKDCDKHREESLKMEDEYEKQIKALKLRLEEEKKKCAELEKQKQLVEELQSQITSFEEKTGWLERRLEETEDSLNTTMDEKETTLVCMKAEHEDEISQMNTSHAKEVEDLKSTLVKELQQYTEKKESHLEEIKNLSGQVKKLKQEIKDGVNEKKIHEKKGQSTLKDLKKQLQAERKRAEKLQDKLQEVLSDSRHNKSMEDLFRPVDPNESWREDQSSVSSWSAGASGAGTFISSTSGAQSQSQSPQSPTTSRPSPVLSDMEQEYQGLLSRVAELQQEKWDLEEKVSHLETSTAAMADDLIQKARIIEHYVMETRTDTKPHPHVNEDKISLKKVLDLVNKGDDVHGLKEMNKKLQNILEETLTKNMHLQKDLETLSQEVVRLSKLTVKNDTEQKPHPQSPAIPGPSTDDVKPES